jgi:hypothetical protein
MKEARWIARMPGVAPGSSMKSFIEPQRRDDFADPRPELETASCKRPRKKQGATGITTVAPYVAGLWGRGMTGCRNDARRRDSFREEAKLFNTRLSDDPS